MTKPGRNRWLVSLDTWSYSLILLAVAVFLTCSSLKFNDEYTVFEKRCSGLQQFENTTECGGMLGELCAGHRNTFFTCPIVTAGLISLLLASFCLGESVRFATGVVYSYRPNALLWIWIAIHMICVVTTLAQFMMTLISLLIVIMMDWSPWYICTFLSGCVYFVIRISIMIYTRSLPCGCTLPPCECKHCKERRKPKSFPENLFTRPAFQSCQEHEILDEVVIPMDNDQLNTVD